MRPYTHICIMYVCSYKYVLNCELQYLYKGNIFIAVVQDPPAHAPYIITPGDLHWSVQSEGYDTFANLVCSARNHC